MTKRISPVTLGGVLAGVAVALLFVALGGHGGGGPASQRLEAPPTPPPAHYAGLASDGAPVTVTAARGGVRWTLDSAGTRNCRPAGHGTGTAHAWGIATRLPGKQFSQSFTYRWRSRGYSDTFTIRLRGAFVARRAQGTFVRRDRFAHGRASFTCERASTWSAPAT